MTRHDSGLTTKQAIFAEAVISGKRHVEAYRLAYDCSRSKEATVQRKAVEVYQHPAVSAYIQSARESVSDNSVATLQELCECATTLLREGMRVKTRLHRSGKEYEGRDPETVLAASKELSKLKGWDKLKVDVTSNGGVLGIPTMAIVGNDATAWLEQAQLMLAGGGDERTP